MTTPSPHDRAGDVDRQVVLAEVQDRRPHRARDVGTIVDCPQRAVPLGGRRERLEQPRLVAGLEALLAKLHDVDAVAEHGIQELLEVTVPRARVNAQVETGTTQAGHRATVIWRQHGSSPRAG